MMKRLFFLAALSVSALHGYAQPNNGGPAPQPNPTAVPLDGGAGLLLAGGIGLALRKLRQKRRK